MCELDKAAEEAAQGRQSVSRACEPRMMRIEDAEDSQDGGGRRVDGWMLARVRHRGSLRRRRIS